MSGLIYCCYIYIIILLWFSSLFPAKMPRQRRIPGLAPVEEVRDVRDWVVSPSGERSSLVRIPGPATDPDHIWWQPMGSGSHPDQVWWQREQAPELVIRRRIRDEDAHVRRYLSDLDRNFSNTWSFIQRVPNPNMSYAPVRVPFLWARSARSGPCGLGCGRS